MIVARAAWLRVNDFLTLADATSLGSSWWAVSVVTCGWLRPNASASSPARSRLASNVTSNPPVSPGVVTSIEDGIDRGAADGRLERHVEGRRRSTGPGARRWRAGPPAPVRPRGPRRRPSRYRSPRPRPRCSVRTLPDRIEDVRGTEGAVVQELVVVLGRSEDERVEIGEWGGVVPLGVDQEQAARGRLGRDVEVEEPPVARLGAPVPVVRAEDRGVAVREVRLVSGDIRAAEDEAPGELPIGVLGGLHGHGDRRPG